MRRAARAACENDVNDTVKEMRRQITWLVRYLLMDTQTVRLFFNAAWTT